MSVSVIFRVLYNLQSMEGIPMSVSVIFRVLYNLQSMEETPMSVSVIFTSKLSIKKDSPN